MSMFDRLAPYIREYIYNEKWAKLKDFQIEACKAVFDSDNNLLLTSGTASGKTEAAFLPVLTKLYYEPSKSVGIMYVSPLKALINDQFERLDYLLKEGDIPVCKWHGDASRTAKNKLIKNPKGVIQITPESLESLLINRKSDCIRLFSDLRFIIIDEVHYFMDSPRGIQLVCILERLQRLIGIIPRRIGLSATLGDVADAEIWLSFGTNRQCVAPMASSENSGLALAVECFCRKGDETDDELDTGYKEQLEFIYKTTLNNKCIIFCNSRHDTEFTISNLKELAVKKHTKDVYRVHHGSISAIIREDTEREMKLSEESIITGATVTLELGIDIGSLDMVVQMGAPYSVSSLMQRKGRCGRRGQRSKLLFSFIEKAQKNNDNFGDINWELLRGIALLQIMIEENGWVEPIKVPHYPYAMLYHQTMAYLLENGEVSPAMLAQSMLTLSPFKDIPQCDYEILLKHLMKIGHIEKIKCGGLILSEKGERIVNNYEFYAVFETPKEYLVKYENVSIGTIDEAIPAGTRFVLAGHSWECISIDKTSCTIFVKQIHGKAKNKWMGSGICCIHTKVLKKMREVLLSAEKYRYMQPGCMQSLERMRQFAQESSFANKIISPLSNSKYAVFPWVGTEQIYTLYFALDAEGYDVTIDEHEPYYLIVKTGDGINMLIQKINDILNDPLDKHTFKIPDDAQIPFKYNDFIPKELLRKQFMEDRIDVENLIKDISIDEEVTL